MRKIQKTVVPAEYQQILDKALELRKKDIADFRKNPPLKPTIGEYYKNFREFILKTHLQKCAYCESKIENQPGDVEHFRPKGRVTDQFGNIVNTSIEGKSSPHPGYFWLAYDVDNLLMSCIDCNRRRKHAFDDGEGLTSYGKEDCFPIKGKRAYSPEDPLDLELPLLINPVQEDPLTHLELEETGLLKGRTPEGEATISILGLNRENLRENRLDMMMAAEKLVGDLMAAKTHQNQRMVADCERRVYEIAKEKAAYTLACWKGLLRGLAPHRDLLSPNVLDLIVKSHEARMTADNFGGGG
ncbi:hypothetical protein NKI96_24410 [Mesorhizobium sp. M0292]|uniref:hypothetical protein n=1 Tax=Mesorhizobium sp. M0292 TaxID=2956929 RepID=UPI0033357583